MRQPRWQAISLLMCVFFLIYLALDLHPAKADETDPVVNIPTPTLPRPNGFDTILAAGNAMVDRDRIVACYADQDGKAYSLRAMMALVAKNTKALALLRQGLRQQYLQPPVRSFNVQFPYFFTDRDLARLMMVEARIYGAHHQWTAAANCYMEVLDFGAHVKQGAPLIGYLVGEVIQSMMLKDCWKIIEHFDLRRTTLMRARVQAIIDKDVTLVTALREEKWVEQAMIMSYFSDKKANWRLTLALACGSEVLLSSKHELMDHFSAYFDAWIQIAPQRYPVQRTMPMPNDPISKVLAAQLFPKAALRAANLQAQQQLLLTALALQAYHLRHGVYPETLALLVPCLLHALPPDPFSQIAPLCYHRHAGTYLLYSIGPDGVDDGGKTVTNPRHCDPDSKGDIVAGVF